MHTLSSALVPKSERFDFWREIIGGLYDVQRPSMDEDDFTFDSKFTRRGNVLVSEVSCSPTTKWRDKRNLSRDGHEYLKLRRYERGTCILTSDERPVLLRPGATYLMKQSREFTEISSDNHQFNIFLPAGLLGVDISAIPSVVEFRDETGRGAIIRAAIEALFSREGSRDNRFQVAAVSRLCSTIGELFAGGETGFEIDDLVTVRRKAIEDEIEKYLRETWCGTEQLLAKLPFSRATLYRHFEGEGGIAAYLRRRRLTLAFEELSKSSGYGAVSRVAEKSGYSSVHSFHKAFKREFDSTPGEIVGTKCASNDNCIPQVSTLVDGHDSFQALTLAWQQVRGLR